MGKKRNPGVVIVGSFLCVAVIGILLLSLPLMTTDGQGLGFSDAAFMAVSGSCIIGLTVIDVSADLTFWGQLVLLILIQTGGVGFMTLATAVFAALGIRMGFSYRNLMKESLNHNTYYDIFSLTLTVVRYTFLIEGIGALLLALRFIPLFGWSKGLWYSIFHAVSAFNNAGFDLFGTSLEGFVGAWYINIVFMFLIIIGVVITNVANNAITGAILMQIVVAMAPSMGIDNPAPLAMTITMAMFLAILTPAASPYAAVLHANK